MGSSIIAQNKKPVTKPVVIATVLKTSTDSLQYAAGAYIASMLRNNGLQQMYAQPLFQKGIADKFSNTGSPMNDSIVMAKMNQYMQKLTEESGKLQEQQLFAALRNRQGVGVLPSGVNYEIVTKGTGALATINDSVLVNIKGQTVGGVLITDSYRDKQPITLSLASVIKGLSEPITMMPEGSKWNIYIPAALGYGDKGVNGIVPPYSALEFEVELLKIKKVSPITK